MVGSTWEVFLGFELFGGENVLPGIFWVLRTFDMDMAWQIMAFLGSKKNGGTKCLDVPGS